MNARKEALGRLRPLQPGDEVWCEPFGHEFTSRAAVILTVHPGADQVYVKFEEPHRGCALMQASCVARRNA